MHMDMSLLHTTLNELVWIYNSGPNYIYKQFWRIRVVLESRVWFVLKSFFLFFEPKGTDLLVKHFHKR